MVKVNTKNNTHSVLILASSNLILQILGFIYRIMLTKLVGTEALGLQSLIMQIYSIAVSICISGMNVAVVTLSSRLSHLGNGAIRRLVKTAFSIYLILFFAMALPIFSFRDMIAEKFIGDAETKNTLILILVCIFLTGIENLLKSIHIGTGRIKTTAASELTEQIARFIIVFMLLKNCFNSTGYDSTNEAAVFFIILGMVLSEFFSVGFLTVSYVKSYRTEAIQDLQTIKEDFISILAPAAFTGIASTAFESTYSLLLPTRLMAAGYTRSVALGSIGMLGTVATPIVMFPMAIIGALSSVYLPLVSDAAGNNDSERLSFLIKRSMKTAAIIALIINIGLFPFFQKIAELFFGIIPGKKLFALLSLKAIIIYFQIICTMVLNGMMKQKIVLLYAVISELIQLILIYHLSAIPFLHVYGYLISMVIGEGLRLVLSFITVRRYINSSNAHQTKPVMLRI